MARRPWGELPYPEGSPRWSLQESGFWSGDELGLGTGVLGPDSIRVGSLDKAPGSQWGRGGGQGRSPGSSRKRRTGEEKEAWGSSQHGRRKPGLQLRLRTEGQGQP